MLHGTRAGLVLHSIDPLQKPVVGDAFQHFVEYGAVAFKSQNALGYLTLGYL